MFITAEEKESDSPLQSLLEGLFILLKLERVCVELDKPSNHTEVQEAVNDAN